MTCGAGARMIGGMRLLKLIVLAALGASLISVPATAKPARVDRCAALKGHDLAPGKGQRAVRRGAELRFCSRGGAVRRLGGSPSVRGADGHLLLVHRRGRVQVLDVSTGRLGHVGAVGAVVQAKVVASAGAVAVRRDAQGDALVVVAPGRRDVVVDRGPEPVEALEVLATTASILWRRAGGSYSAVLPHRAVTCGRLRGADELEGPGRIVGFEEVYFGCIGGGDAPAFIVGSTEAYGLDLATAQFTAGHGSWVLRESSESNQYHFGIDWTAIDLATGRMTDIASRSGGFCCPDGGEALREQMVLADGRVVAILDAVSGTGDRGSRVVVLTPAGDHTALDSTEPGAPKALGLRVEGDVVRWTVGDQVRSAPLPELG